MSQMKLSEAMRLGALLRPQVKNKLFVDGGSCAIGAVLGASGLGSPEHTEPNWFRILPKRFVLLCNQIIWDEIVRRNNCGETREAIADWLETLEGPVQDNVQVQTIFESTTDRRG